jgi:hypothetical protein
MTPRSRWSGGPRRHAADGGATTSVPGARETPIERGSVRGVNGSTSRVVTDRTAKHQGAVAPAPEVPEPPMGGTGERSISASSSFARESISLPKPRESAAISEDLRGVIAIYLWLSAGILSAGERGRGRAHRHQVLGRAVGIPSISLSVKSLHVTSCRQQLRVRSLAPTRRPDRARRRRGESPGECETPQYELSGSGLPGCPFAA